MPEPNPPAHGRGRRAGSGARITLIDRYLVAVVGSRVLICLGATFAVMMLERTLRLATQMAAAGAHLGYLWPMIWNLAPHYVGLALGPSLTLAMLLSIARLDGDDEIEAMLASGYSLARVLGVLVGLGLVIGIAGLLVIGFMEPHGRFGFRSARDAAASAGWTARLQPAAFQSRDGGVTMTADGTDAAGRRLVGVFIDRVGPDGTEVVVTAPSGELGLAADGRTAHLELGPGRLSLARPGRPPVDGGFARYALSDPYQRLGDTVPRGIDQDELTLPELIGRARGRPGPVDRNVAKAELNSRLVRMAELPLLPLLALPLGLASKRGRRGASMALAGVVVMLFHEAQRLAQSLSVMAGVDPAAVLWSIFGAFAALAVWIFLSSHRLLGETILARGVQRVQALIDRRPKVWARMAGWLRPSLGGYVAGALLLASLATWAGLVGLLATIDLFEKSDDVLARGLGLAGVAHYALLRLPVIAEQMAPLAVLGGGTMAFSHLNRGGELVALRASGISLFRILMMTLPVALAMSGLVVVLAEVAAPRAQLALADWWRVTAPSPPAGGARHAPGRVWFRAGDEIVSAVAVSADGARMSGVTIYRRDRGSVLVAKLGAARADAGPRDWTLHGASMAQLEGREVTVTPLGEMSWTTPLRSNDLARLVARPLQTSALDAARALQGGAATDQSLGYLVTRLHRALAEPFGPVVMLLLCLPLATPGGRFRRQGWLLVYALAGGLVYVVVDGVCAAAGQTGLATPWLAAWLAPVLFLGAALTILVFSDN